MDYTRENITPIKIKFSVASSASEVDNLVNKNLREIQGTVNLPGFRRGKAPASLLEKKYKNEILENAKEELIRSNLEEILARENLTPLAEVNIKQPEVFEKGQDASWSFEFEVMPEIDVPEYKGLKTTQAKTVLPEKNIDETIRNMKNLSARVRSLNSHAPAKDGQFASIDVELLDNGVSQPDFNLRNYELEVGAESLHPDIDAIVRGLPVGNIAEKEISFPENYPNQALAGQTRQIRVKVNSVYEKDDSDWEKNWAGEDGKKRLDDLREAIGKIQFSQIAEYNKNVAEGKLLDQLLKQVDFPIPETFKNIEYRRLLQEYERRLQSKGASLSAMGERLDETLTQINKNAELAASQMTLLLAVAKKAGLTLSDDELADAISNYSHESGRDFQTALASLQDSGMLLHFRYKLLADKAMDLIYTNAEITEVDGRPQESAATETDSATQEQNK